MKKHLMTTIGLAVLTLAVSVPVVLGERHQPHAGTGAEKRAGPLGEKPDHVGICQAELGPAPAPRHAHHSI